MLIAHRSDRSAAAVRARACCHVEPVTQREHSLKMSLCNTFRLSVVCCIIVLSNIDARVAAFTISRTTTGIDPYRDLVQQESVLQELKEFKVSDNTNLTEQYVTEPDLNDRTTNITNETLVQTNPTSFNLADVTPISSDFENITEIETTTDFIDISTSVIKVNNNTNKIKHHFQIHPKDKSRPTPKWKKYKTIERKRPSHSSEEKRKEKIKQNFKGEILKAESKHVRVTLQDTVTSDIPSLESLKNDLLSSNLNLQTSESKNGVTLQSLLKDETSSMPTDFTPSISQVDSSSQVGHESKRAGFLNYSGKTMTTTVIVESTISEITTETPTTVLIREEFEKFDSKSNNNQPRDFEIESPATIVLENKIKNDPQIVMNDDAIKEELLKEDLINDNENVKRQREDLHNNKANLTEIQNIDPVNSAESNSSSELNTKLINYEKLKNITLYTVNSNYKPMKKIEVVPPKQFVRDPDDNSWRNESLSSLGIVFKPKNSSKPFSQVLKNKTETEWNNFTEKDIKNDLPDLRERLQKMAEKRKSKRKKIDTFGNIVYFDYEENSNSAEHAPVTIDELSSTVTTYSPSVQNTNQNNGSSTEGPQNVTETVISTLTTEELVNKNSYPTKIPKKLFHEYYDSTDEDDSDYLNMANIDLKKFTTSLRSSTPFHPSTIVAKQPDWLKQSNAFPERKATVQYFPPLTTRKVNINDYDNGFKFKMESFTTETDVPKHIVPISTDGPTTPVPVSSKSDFTKNLMLTRSQVTTQPGPSIKDDGSFDRGTYIIKHYRDFVNEAARDSEYDKNYGYVPYTEAPVEGVTKTDFIGFENETPKPIDSGYDYESQFRKDVLQRFVDNFNQNSDRYRAEFPILFNSSIIHRGMQDGRDTASSRAFMRGSYSRNIFKPKKPCEPNCGKITVELSPAYEVHYYVPEQEEKEEAAQPVTLPYQYGL